MKKPIWHRPLGDDAWMLVTSVCSRRDSSRRTPRVHRDAVRTLRTVVDEVADEDPASWIDKREAYSPHVLTTKRKPPQHPDTSTRHAPRHQTGIPTRTTTRYGRTGGYGGLIGLARSSGMN